MWKQHVKAWKKETLQTKDYKLSLKHRENAMKCHRDFSIGRKAFAMYSDMEQEKGCDFNIKWY